MTVAMLLLTAVLGQSGPPPETLVGPRTGTLVIDGGGRNPAADPGVRGAGRRPGCRDRADPDGR